MVKKLSRTIAIFVLIQCVIGLQPTYAQSTAARKIAEEHNKIMLDFWGNYLPTRPKLDYPFKKWIILDEFENFCKLRNLVLGKTKNDVILIAENPVKAVDEFIKNKEANEFIKWAVNEMIKNPEPHKVSGLIEKMKEKAPTIKDKEAAEKIDLFIAQADASLKLLTSERWKTLWNNLWEEKENRKSMINGLEKIKPLNEALCSLVEIRNGESNQWESLKSNIYYEMLPDWAKKLINVGVAVAADCIGVAVGGAVAGAAVGAGCTTAAVTLLK